MWNLAGLITSAVTGLKQFITCLGEAHGPVRQAVTSSTPLLKPHRTFTHWKEQCGLSTLPICFLTLLPSLKRSEIVNSRKLISNLHVKEIRQILVQTLWWVFKE